MDDNHDHHHDQDTPKKTPSDSDSETSIVSVTITQEQQEDEEHISISPPTPHGAMSHSNQYSEDHISLSPSPPHSSKTRPQPVTTNHLILSESTAIVKMDYDHDDQFVQHPTSMKAATTNKSDDQGEVLDDHGSVQRRVRPPSSDSMMRRLEKDKMLKKAGLGFRIFGFLFCLISFSILAADRNQGWAIDSFQRYVEFRYCMSVNVIGFVYSGAQAFNLSYHLTTGKYIVQQQHRRYFDFAFDQMIAYLLISASSSAVIRIDDWQLNWGKDKFPDMATASVSMSFLAFIAIAFSSLISGYALCTSKSR